MGAGLGVLSGAVLCSLTNANKSQCAAMMIAGGIAGYVIASKLLPADKPPRNAAVTSVLEGSPNRTWTSADTGNTGNIRLLGVTTDASGRQCKRMQEHYNRSGEGYDETYTMCKGPNGWVTV